MLSEPYNFTEDDVEKNRNELEDIAKMKEPRP